jgi:hypothetical protein
MARTPFRTPVEDFIVTPGDVVRGEDQAAGGAVIVRGGSSTGGGNPGGDLSLTGGAGNAAGGGGTVLVMGGTAGATGAGGGVTLQGSNAGMGIGGYVLLTGGDGAGGGERGTVRVTNTALEFVEAVSVPGGVTVAARGRVWVRNDVPNVLIFTDGAGVDTVLGGAATLASVVASVGVSPSLQSAPFVWQIADTESLTFEGVTANEDLLVLAHVSGADVVTLGHGTGDRLNALSATNNFFFGAVFDSASAGPPLQGIQVGVTTNTIDSLASGTAFLIKGLDVGAGGTAGEITLRGGNKAAGVASDGGAASLLGGSTAATGLSAGGAVKVTGGEATGGDATSVGGAVTITGGQNLSSTAGAVTVSGGMGDTGGSLLVQAGEGGTVAGTATLRGGAASVGALIPGGDITVIGGAGDSDDIGGAVFITGGPAGAGNSVGPGAAVTITGGTGGTASGDGGHVSILGGAPGAAASDGGSIFLIPSLGTGVGVDGIVDITGDVTITGKLTVGGLIDPTGLVLDEQAAVPMAPVPGKGVLWVRNNNPNVLLFTGDTGIDQAIEGSRQTALGAGDFALSAAWGSTASITAITGSDSRFILEITSAGIGQAANPTITLTYVDGAWSSAPFPMISDNGSIDAGGGVLRPIFNIATRTTTQVVWDMFDPVPVAGDVYRMIVHVMN